MNPLCFSCVLPTAASAQNLVPKVATAGFEGIEPTFTLADGLPNGRQVKASAQALRTLADDASLNIPGMRAGPAFWDRFISPQAGLRVEAVDLAEKAFEALQILGGDTLLAVPGRWTNEQDYASAWRHGVETARKIGEVAQHAGITLALENVENEFLCSPRDWADFLQEIDHPSVGMYFDVGNVVRNRQGPPARWIALLGPKWIRRIHFKGACSGGAPMALLDGDVPWPDVITALRKLDYRGWIGLELTPPAVCTQEWLKITCLTAREILSLN